MISIRSFVPHMITWCLSGKSDKQKLNEFQIKFGEFSARLCLCLCLSLILYKYFAANHCKVVKDLSKAQNDRSVLKRKLRESENRCRVLQDKLTQQKKEREGAVKQATQLSSTIQELEQWVQRLEDQKDQIEEDRFTAQTALKKLQSQHIQVIGSRL